MSVEIDRRRFLKRMAVGAGATALTLATSSDSPIFSDVRFPPSELGTVLNIRNIWWHKISPEQVLNLPYNRTRVPVPFDLVCPDKPGRFNWEIVDALMDLAVFKGKDIELQIGAKTVGWPEVNVPGWFLREFSYLRPSGYPKTIDEDPLAQEYILGYADQAAERYLSGRWGNFITSLFVENEGFSQNLDVSGRRYISLGFYKREVRTVREHDRYKRPLVQNIPFDTPEAISTVLNHTDIIGWNIYNQKGSNSLDEALMWFGVNSISEIARMLGRSVRVTEYQSAPWLDSQGRAKHPFSWQKFLRGLSKLQQLNPHEGIYLWDTEQTLASNNRQAIALLHSLAA